MQPRRLIYRRLAVGGFVMLMLGTGVVFVLLAQDQGSAAVALLALAVATVVGVALAPEQARRIWGLPPREGRGDDNEALRRARGSLGFFGQLLSESPSAQAEEERKDALQLVRLIERVRGDYSQRLDQALHHSIHLALGLDDAPGSIVQALDIYIPMDRTSRPLPTGTTIRDVFAQAGDWGSSKLLILGEPGAGKTMMLLELATKLIDEAQPDLPAVPVYVPLSSWGSGRWRRSGLGLTKDSAQDRFERYAARQVSELYAVSAKTARRWVSSGQLLFLLDGLDEIADVAEREDCVASLNQYVREHPTSAIVCCCRRADYEVLQERLTFSEAVLIRSLQEAEVMKAARDGGRRLAGMRAALKEDLALRELCSSPLFLSIVTLTYAGLPASRIRDSGTVAERRERLLEDYVELQLQRRRGQRATHQDAARESACDREWLGHLARAMEKSNETVFLLERMQPDWLPLGFRAMAIVPAFALWILMRGLVTDIGALLLAPLAFYTLAGSFTLAGRLTWSWRAAFDIPTVISSAILGGFLGLFTGAINHAIVRHITLWPIGVTLSSPMGGMVLGIIFGGIGLPFILGFGTATVVSRARPYDGIRRSLFTGLRIAVLIFLIVPPFDLLIVKTAGVSTHVIAHTSLHVGSPTLSTAIATGIDLSIAFSLAMGLGAIVGHFWVRCGLWITRRGPLRYVTWLENMVLARLLYRSGAGYVFIHGLLQDHLSGANTDEADEAPEASAA